jgi:hypothetical protein
MDPVTLIVTALAAGATSVLQDDVKGAVKQAFTRLQALVKRRLGGRSSGEFVLAQHEQAPDIYEKPLEAELNAVNAAADSDVIAAAQELMRLLDSQGTAAGKYTVSIRNSSGVQVGEHNTQVNNFGVATPRDAYVAGRDINRRW